MIFLLCVFYFILYLSFASSVSAENCFFKTVHDHCHLKVIHSLIFYLFLVYFSTWACWSCTTMVTQNTVLPKNRWYNTAEGCIFSDCSIKNSHPHLAQNCTFHDNSTGSSSWKKRLNSTQSLLQIYDNAVFKWHWRSAPTLHMKTKQMSLLPANEWTLKPFEINHLYILFTLSDMQMCTITSRGGWTLFTWCHWTCQRWVWWVQTGVSRTFHDLGFPAHRAQEQLFARHLRNHDCANAARPPQRSLSSGTVLTAHAGDSPAKSCQDPGTARLCPSGNFRVMLLDVVGAQAMGTRTCIFIF